MYRHLWLPPYPTRLVFKWTLLAFMAGCINTGGYMVCSRFVTHVTGFATWFGIEAVDNSWFTAFGMLSVPFYFLLGVMVGAYFTDTALTRGRVPRFRLVMMLEAFLLATAAIGGYFDLFGFFGGTFVLEKDYALIVLLCTASGLQNAAITISSGGLMRSTHLTGTTTDLGVGLVRAIWGHALPGLQKKEFYRNWLRVGTILGFVLGCVAGAIIFTVTKYLGFLLPALLAVYVGNFALPPHTALAPAAEPGGTPLPSNAPERHHHAAL